MRTSGDGSERRGMIAPWALKERRENARLYVLIGIILPAIVILSAAVSKLHS